MGCAAFTEGRPEFCAKRAYRLAESISIRREEFGALAYDFRSRRLTMINSRVVARLVETLSEFPSAEAAAMALAGPGEGGGRLLTALQQLYRREVLDAR
jgi:putative mycofactocin binding protein MftB